MPDMRHLTVFLAALLASPEAFASAELARAKNCVACHAAERRMVGPPYTAIAERYVGDDTAVRVLSERMLAGTTGAWGRMPMPPQPNLSQAEAEALVRWILTHR